MGFREFLAEQELVIRDQEGQRKRRLDHWVGSVKSLIEQIKEWAEDSDTSRILDVEDRMVQKREKSLGMYAIPELTIGLGGRAVVVNPIGCDILGPRGIGRKATTWLGRVDLVGSKTYRLYLSVDGDGEQKWVALDEESYAIRAFDRDFFDGAMVELFS